VSVAIVLCEFVEGWLLWNGCSECLGGDLFMWPLFVGVSE
jgi:hypothetical protein